jgi:hypothetical protein
MHTRNQEAADENSPLRVAEANPLTHFGTG